MSDKIQFVCPYCSHQVQVSPAVIGKKGKCPGCGQIVRITAPGQTSPPQQQPQQQPSSIPQLQPQQPQQKSSEELKKAAAGRKRKPPKETEQERYERHKYELDAAQETKAAKGDRERFAQQQAARKASWRRPTASVTNKYFGTGENQKYTRGTANCPQCTNNFGEAVLLDGTRIKCPNCGIFVELPVIHTPYWRAFTAACDEEERRKGYYIRFGGFSVLAVVLFFCLRFTETDHFAREYGGLIDWSNMVFKIGIGGSVCVAVVFFALIVLRIVRIPKKPWKW